ncbi:MAG: 16S rRNA (cytosine(967)-C(5))-methyltransferase RsmB [Gammaproteobacteria bacterium]|nr:16S rRNA (cytosine(967)-C(5))-methyltransferase RsmB [Gammaproteobacteria bacterium]
MAGAPRAAAARGIARVIQGGSLNDLLPAILAGHREPADRALIQELVYGSLRFAPRIEFLLTELLDRPVRKREPRVHALLMVGLYQLLYMRTADHAAVSETVEAARLMKKPWAAGLVNAVLRRVQRERDALEAKADAHPVGRSAHPAWMLEQFQQDWPDDWESIVEANNSRAPMTLRVNAQRGSRDAYLGKLADAGIAADAHSLAVDGVTLETPTDVSKLPGFVTGEVSVQDAAAQLVADVVHPEAGQRIVDACAAPGGKTGHLLERQPDLATLVALDRDPDRLDRVAENLARLELSATLKAADAARLDEWWQSDVAEQPEPFDVVLLDAPCSGTGVIRRHPDIKLLRRPKDIASLESQQARLLDMLWHTLKPGGRLVYTTCSVLRAENERQVANFIQRHDAAVSLPISSDWGRPAGFGRQVLPGEAGMDGFFYAVILKDF